MTRMRMAQDSPGNGALAGVMWRGAWCSVDPSKQDRSSGVEHAGCAVDGSWYLRPRFELNARWPHPPEPQEAVSAPAVRHGPGNRGRRRRVRIAIRLLGSSSAPTTSFFVGHMQQPHTITLSALATPVVPRRRVRIAVPHQALNRRKIDAGVEKIAGERASEIMRREVRNASSSGTGCLDMVDRLICQPLGADMPAAPDPDEEWSWRLAAHRQPVLERLAGSLSWLPLASSSDMLG